MKNILMILPNNLPMVGRINFLGLTKLRSLSLLATGVLTTFIGTIEIANSASFGDVRQLTKGEFFATNDLLTLNQDWFYDGTLTDFDESWEREYIWENIIGVEFGRTSVLGNRFASTANNFYQFQFRGEYEDVSSVLGFAASYSSNLVNENANRTSGDDIPTAWQSGDGYGTPIGINTSFKRDYRLVKEKFEVGEFGCPATVPGTDKETDHCIFEEAWFGGMIDLEGRLQAVGDISNVIAGAQTVNVQAETNRKSRFRVNNQTLVELADLQDSNTRLRIEEGREFDDVNIEFETFIGADKRQVQVDGDTVWVGDDVNSKSVNAFYNDTASTINFLSAGKANQYIVEFFDDPELLAGINGTDFNSALVFTKIGASNPEESHKLVAKAIPVSVPEPSTMVGLFAVGGLGVASKLKKKSK